jgi:hypothetical protein
MTAHKTSVELSLGCAMSDKKLFRRRRNRRNKWLVPWNRKLSEFPSEPFHRGEKCSEFCFCGTKIETNSRNSVPNHSTEEKNARNSVFVEQKRNKLSEFRSKPFRGRENNSEFHSVEQKYKQILGIPKHFAHENTLSVLFYEARFCCKTHFFPVIPFRSELRN